MIKVGAGRVGAGFVPGPCVSQSHQAEGVQRPGGGQSSGFSTGQGSSAWDICKPVGQNPGGGTPAAAAWEGYKRGGLTGKSVEPQQDRNVGSG